MIVNFIPSVFFRTVQFNLDAVPEVETISSLSKTSSIFFTEASRRANSTALFARMRPIQLNLVASIFSSGVPRI